MNKIIKLNMFNNLVDAPGIRALVNTKTFSFAPTPALAPFPTPTVEASTHVLEVDHLANSTTILTVGEPTSPSTSTKRALEEEQQSPRTECSPK